MIFSQSPFTPKSELTDLLCALYREGDPEFVKRQDQKRSELDEQLKDYITEWRKQRNKEEEELKRLKEKQAKRKVTRAEEEQRMAQRKKEDEERRVREVEEKKQREADEKRMRLEEAEKKRQAMIQAQKDKDKKGPNFTIQKREDGAVSIAILRNGAFGVEIPWPTTFVEIIWKTLKETKFCGSGFLHQRVHRMFIDYLWI